MKKLLLICIILSGLRLSAQDQTTTNAVVKQLITYFNADQYAELYQQLTPEFRKAAPEQSITSFYKQNLKTQLGQIRDWKYTGIKNGAAVYQISFERGNQELTLAISAGQKIAGMLWSPPKVAVKDPATIKNNNPRQTKIQLYVDSLALDYLKDPGNSSLSIGLITDGKVESFFYGETKKGTGKLPDGHSLYEIASISKTFTGIMLAHAINQHKIALNDPLTKYLTGNYPGLQFKGEPIRMIHLSNHTSGLPSLPANLDKQPGFDPANPYVNYNKDMIYQYLKNFQIDTLPGNKADYSNLAFGILGLTLENTYKMPLEKLLQQVITGPLKMQHTHYAVSPDQQSLLATGYNNANGNAVSYWNLGDFKAAGGLKSDLHDMLIYLQANITATNPDIALSQKKTSQQQGFSRGLAWMIEPLRTDTMIWHNGGTAGFRSFCGFLKNKKNGVVVLSNSNAEADALARKLLIFLP
jgi:CubicO group peptidase (beta-lactamase class C family)